MSAPLDHALHLLHKAGNDLIAASATVATGEALDTVCFHAQQAAEKSVKALLALDDMPYPLTHDLGALLTLALGRWPELEPLARSVAGLTPYAVGARYAVRKDPSMDEAAEALATAREVYGLVQGVVAQAPRPAGDDPPG